MYWRRAPCRTSSTCPRFRLPVLALFVAERVDGVGPGRFHGLVADREERDDDGQDSAEDEEPPLETDPVGECPEPPVHEIECQRPGDEVGQKDGLEELAGERKDDPPDGGAEGLVDSDFLGPALEDERSQAEKPEAGDEDCQRPEVRVDALDLLLVGIFQAEIVVDEEMAVLELRYELFKSLFQEIEGRRDVGGADPDGYKAEAIGVELEDRRVDGRLEALVVEVPDDPGEDRRAEQLGRGEFLLGKGVEGRQDRNDEEDSEKHPDEGQEEGLAQELADELPPLGAEDLPQADLLSSRSLERLGRIAGQELVGEDPEEVLVGGVEIRDIDVPSFLDELGPAELDDTGIGEHFRDGLLDGRGQGGRRRGETARRPPDRAVRVEPVDPVASGVVLVVAELVADKHQDQKATGHSDGQPHDIDRGECLVLPQVSERDFKEISEH